MTATLIIGAAILLLFAIVLIGRRQVNKNIVQYEAGDVAGRLRTGKIILLDVRTDNERAVKSIPRSLHIPLHELAGRADELNAHRDKEIVCYCQSGNRSIAAADQLGKRGFKAASMKGGIMAWS